MESCYNVNVSSNRRNCSTANSGQRPCDMRQPDRRQMANCNPHARQHSGYNPGAASNRMMPQKPLRGQNGRNIEVECVCKVNNEKSCHMDDPMEKLGCRFPIAMAYVPWQQWGELYEPDCALTQGTIFKDLNKIFCGVRC